MRFDGIDRKRTNIFVSKEALRLFEDISKVNLSEYVEDKILEDFDNPHMIIEKRDYHLNELQRLNNKIKTDNLKQKQEKEFEKQKQNIMCDICGYDFKDPDKNLVKLEKGKYQVCKNCFKSTPNILKALKEKQGK